MEQSNTRVDAERERLTKLCDLLREYVRELTAIVLELEDARAKAINRAVAAEDELDTLRSQMRSAD